jgi:hypothetical protein
MYDMGIVFACVILGMLLTGGEGPSKSRTRRLGQLSLARVVSQRRRLGAGGSTRIRGGLADRSEPDHRLDL